MRAHISKALRDLLSEGAVTVTSMRDANEVATASEAQGSRTHISSPIYVAYREGVAMTYLPFVELCQGKHCHCQY